MRGLPPVQPPETATQRVLPVEPARRLLCREAYPNVVHLLRTLHSSEGAEILRHLTLSEQLKVLERLPDLALATAIFTYLHADTRTKLLPHLSTERLAAMVRLLPPDDATDILATVPPERLTEMLGQLPEALAAAINTLLAYDPQIAGGLMTTSYVALEETCTVGEALARLRRVGQEEPETVFYLYIVDAAHHLVGVVLLRQLVMAEPETTLRAVMGTDVVRVGVHEDQEHIAQLITQYDVLALPVVDHSGRLVGIVTVDDIIDVISDEATEDMLRMAGVHPDEMLDHASHRPIRHRLPWLAASWVGGLCASYVIDAHQETLRSLVVLAAFFPVITGMGGNTATQALAIAIRGLATGAINPRQCGRVLLRELGVGLVLGGIYGLLLGTVAFMWAGTLLLSLVVGFATCASMTTAAILGGFLPLFFARLRIDPAVASGPLLTTTIDVMALTLYLAMAQWLLLP